MNLEKLSELGLSDGQVHVYAAVLELGVSTLNKIQEKTGIERRNIYDILNKLIKRGLISYIEEKGKRTYHCTHPNKLVEEINKKEAALKALENQIPQIKDMFAATKSETKAEVYRGNESIKALLNEMLNFKESFWIGGNSGVEQTNLKPWFFHWMNKRAQKKIMMYDLADYGTFLRGLEPNKTQMHKKMLYKLCWLPKNLSSPMVIAIFGDKVAQILWSKQSFAFVIESKEIKESFMKYFYYFWKDPENR